MSRMSEMDIAKQNAITGAAALARKVAGFYLNRYWATFSPAKPSTDNAKIDLRLGLHYINEARRIERRHGLRED